MASIENGIFFATSFSGHVDYDTGEVHEDFRHRIESIIEALRTIGDFNVHCSVESEVWKISQEAPGTSMTRNFEDIEANPIFLALVDKTGSDGRGIEIEHAYNSGCQVFLTTGPDEELGWVLQEIVAMGRAEYVPYKEPSDLVKRLRQRIKA